MQVLVEVDGAQEDPKCWTFENHLLSDHPFRPKLREKKVKFVQESLTMVEPFMILEASPVRKKPHQCWDNSDRNM